MMAQLRVGGEAVRTSDWFGIVGGNRGERDHPLKQ